MPAGGLGPLVATIYEVQSALLEPVLKEAGLTWSSFQVLSAVRASDLGACQSEIADQLGLSNAALSEAAFALVEKGMLEQTTSTKDRRRKSLTLTQKAERLLESARARAAQIESASLRGLESGELQQAERVLTQVVRNLGAYE